MPPKRDYEHQDEFNFVAYDPAKKTCNSADRTLIKRRAGRLGGETKRQRLHRDKEARQRLSSPHEDEQAASGPCTTPDNEGRSVPQLVSPYPWPSALATSHPLSTSIRARTEDSQWQGPPLRRDTPKSWNDSQTSSSETNSDRLTTTDPALFNEDLADPLSLSSAFAEPSLVGCTSQDPSQLSEYYLPRPLGSFDSGCFGSESLDFSFAETDANSCPGPAPDVPNGQPTHPRQGQNVTSEPVDPFSWASWPSTAIGARTMQRNSTTLDDAQMDAFGGAMYQRTGNDSNSKSSPSPPRVPSPTENTSLYSTIGTRPTSSEQIDPRKTDHRFDMDDALAKSIRSWEEKPQLSPGCSAECLRALSESEEVRSLWILNLSCVNPELAQSSEQATEIYARAKTKLKSMTHRQQMGIQGILIKLGMANYHAISLAREVTGLQQDLANRKCLGILSKAETLADHILAGLAPSAQSILSHLSSGVSIGDTRRELVTRST